MIEKMAKVEIIGLKDVALDAVDVIHELGTLHIEDLSERIGHMETDRVTRMEMDPKSSEYEAVLNTLRTKVGDMIRELHPDTDSLDSAGIEREYRALWSDNIEVMISRVEKMIREVESDTRDTVDRKSDLMVELSRLEKYAPIMGKVQPLAQRVSKMQDMASIALIIERKFKAILNYLNEEISRITNGECEIISSDVDDESTAALIVFSRRYLKQVHEFLAVQDVNQVRLPADLSKKPIDEAMAEVRARIASIPGEIAEIDKKLVAVTDRYSTRLLAARNAIHDRLDAMEAVPMFGQTDQVFLISGWLPEKEVEPMTQALDRKFGNKVILSVVEIRDEHEAEETPVALRNNPFTRYFEVIYMLSKYPRYGTVDPTIVFAVFFPILVGLMIGDMGYGLIIMVGGWIAHKKFYDKPLINMMGFVLAVAGAWTIVFGVLYLEFFGDWIARAIGVIDSEGHVDHYLLGTEQSIFKFPIDRLEGFTFMLGVSLIIGWVHMGIGLVIGIINGRREGNYKHAIEKGGMLCVLTGVLCILGSFGFPNWPKLLTVGMGAFLAIAGLVLSAVGAGMGGFIEGVVGAGNIFSYARLVAIGLASLIMANVANDLFREQAESGVVGVFIGIIVFVLLHSLNIVIGVFSPSIHSLRLHLVESFGKFFEPATFRYEPFKKTGGEE